MTAETLRTHVPPFDRDLWRGIWRIADPKITLASVASMILGAALAGYDGAISWGWLAITVLGIFCVEAAKNASGEIVDWDSGTDQALRDDERTPFSGGKRVLVDRLMSRGQLAVVAGVFYVLATVAGLLIVGYREPLVFGWASREWRWRSSTTRPHSSSPTAGSARSPWASRTGRSSPRARTWCSATP